MTATPKYPITEDRLMIAMSAETETGQVRMDIAVQAIGELLGSLGYFDAARELFLRWDHVTLLDVDDV